MKKHSLWRWEDAKYILKYIADNNLYDDNRLSTQQLIELLNISRITLRIAASGLEKKAILKELNEVKRS